MKDAGIEWSFSSHSRQGHRRSETNEPNPRQESESSQDQQKCLTDCPDAWAINTRFCMLLQFCGICYAALMSHKNANTFQLQDYHLWYLKQTLYLVEPQFIKTKIISSLFDSSSYCWLNWIKQHNTCGSSLQKGKMCSKLTLLWLILS